MGRRYWVDPADIAAARDVPLIPLLERRGYALKCEGHYYRLPEHDSLVIDSRRNRWYWNSEGIKNANTLDFLVVYEHMELCEAVEELTGQRSMQRKMATVRQVTPPKKPSVCVLPEQNPDNKRVYAYLTKTRRIDPAVVQGLIAAGLLYESYPHHNAVFVRRDEKGKPAGYFERGTLSGSGFKRDWEGSDKQFSFLLPGQDQRLVYVTEAAIDSLSVETLRRKSGLLPNAYPVLSLSCTAANAAQWYLRHCPKVRCLCCCTDSDHGGEVAYQALQKLSGVTVLRCAPPQKDWNEVCQTGIAPEQIPFAEIEKQIKECF